MGSRLVPLALWITALIWVIRVTVFVRQRPGSQFSEIDILAGVQIMMVLMTIVILLVSGRALNVWGRISGTSVRFLFIYYFISALSMLWSPLPQFSLYRGVEFATFLMGVLVALSYSANLLKAEKTMLIVSTIVLLVSMYVNVHFHGFSTSLESWHTNSYSASAAIIFTYCLGEYFNSDKRRKRVLKWFGLLALCALILGTSTASFFAAMAGMALIAFLKRSVVLLIAWTAALGVMVIAIFLLGTDLGGIRDFIFHGLSDEQIAGFHGRLPMWQQFMVLVQESPLIGHGFAVLSTGRGGVFSSSPHNSIFSILLGTGLTGLLVLIIYVLKLLREFMRSTRERRPGAIGCAAAISTGLVNSLAMPLIFDEWEESSLVLVSVITFMTLYVILPYRKGKAQKKFSDTPSVDRSRQQAL